jgi:serine/threonine protein kinase
MTITPGTRIGVHEVTSQLGEGGMGVVYRARDTKLLRDVALKVLPEHFADDPDRLLRLQREAQLLASLNHPNIAQIYGLEQAGNSGCIVMELVEGETLSDKLKRGPLPLDEALEIARQIADALAVAHEKGIVHRDLKPANIKLTPNGTVKVLDFGLAKTLGGQTAESDLTTMPTKVSGSVAGAVVGTLGYMSPEQARGKEVDARTDIWAFGCVLYEMLTARLAFHGETATDLLANIVHSEPDLNLLPPDTPSSIRMLLAATLNKNAQQRLQHIGDMRLFLDQKFFSAAPNAGVGPEASVKKRSSALWLTAIVAALVGALIPIALRWRTPPPSIAPEMRFDLPLNGVQGFATISPDGQRVAYIARPDESPRAIWVRPMASETAQKVPGTDRPTAGITWSPDSRFLAFVSDGKWKKVDVNSGAVQVICDAPPQTIGLTWNRDGVILFSRSNDNLIVRVSDVGGEVKPVMALDQSKKETAHAAPMFLPDGNHFIYAIGSSIPDNAGFYVGALDGSVKKRLVPLPGRLNYWAFAPPGYLLLSDGTLTAYRIDVKNFTVEGEPVPIADGVQSGFAVSDNGVLLYQKATGGPALRQLTWFDHSGKNLGPVGMPAPYADMELSPSGDRAVFDLIVNGNRDIWMLDISRGVQSRITFEPSSDWNPQWSPDGSRLIFASSKPDAAHIYSKSSTGVGTDELVFRSETEIPVEWSHDGRYIVFSRLKPGGNDTWIYDMSTKKASPYIESPFDKAQAKLSPDGRWLAYTTNDSGSYQVVVQSFPNPTVGKWQITAQGGAEPRWRRDGRELYFLTFDGKLMAVPIKAGASFEAGAPEMLFQTPITVNRNQPERTRRYDVASDGRFLLAVPLQPATTSASITAVVNWPSRMTEGKKRN